MAIDATTWVWDHSRSRLGARLVLLAIARYGGLVTISASELGRVTLLSERAVRMAIGELVALGELAVERNAGDSSRYRILMIDRKPEPPAPPGPKRRPISPKVRFLVFDREGWRCVQCGSVEDLTLDHIYPWSLGGSDNEDNLQTLCKPCNSSKGARV